jgi:SPP1 family predicted phage head-tail adaptor
MRAGDLRHTITIQQKTETADAMGGIVQTWSDVVTVRAEVRALSGREFFAAQQVNSEISVKIRIRYRTGIDSTMRAVHGSDIYDIQAVLPVGTTELHLMCKK